MQTSQQLSEVGTVITAPIGQMSKLRLSLEAVWWGWGPSWEDGIRTQGLLALVASLLVATLSHPTASE